MERSGLAIMQFLKSKQYFTKEEVIGVVLSEEELIKVSNNNSDLDIIIVTNNKEDCSIKGVEVIFGLKIQYQEISAKEILKKNFNKQKDYLTNIMCDGLILFERGQQIKEIQEYIKEQYKEPLPVIGSIEINEALIELNNNVEMLLNLENTIEFNHLYNLVIEKIRTFYHQSKGYKQISPFKVNEVYENNEILDSRDVPDEEFINLYNKAIESNSSHNNDKLNAILNLYNYSKKDYSINFNNYQIKNSYQK